MRWITLLLVLAGFLAAACGGGDGTPSATSTPTQPAATATPVPSPTPLGGDVPEGWDRHTTAGFQVDIPQTWEAFDPNEDFVEVLVELVRRLNPESVLQVEQLVSQETIQFFAFDTESVGGELLSSLNVLGGEFLFGMNISAAIADAEHALRDAGGTVLASESYYLPTQRLMGGRVESLFTVGSIQQRTVQYVVLPESTVFFILSLGTSADKFAALEPLFRQIAESFRVISSP